MSSVAFQPRLLLAALRPPPLWLGPILARAACRAEPQAASAHLGVRRSPWKGLQAIPCPGHPGRAGSACVPSPAAGGDGACAPGQ